MDCLRTLKGGELGGWSSVLGSNLQPFYLMMHMHAGAMMGWGSFKW